MLHTGVDDDDNDVDDDSVLRERRCSSPKDGGEGIYLPNTACDYRKQGDENKEMNTCDDKKKMEKQKNESLIIIMAKESTITEMPSTIIGRN
ncbi:hypothetical protein VNO77_34116 [Canavalia gladiata]|uniref:Uncharacterized protein n=1 Tax=Canavalia gladiata TaxID=3824 RepID=A0AAN9KFL7_CANGL